MEARVFICSLENMLASRIKDEIGNQYSKNQLARRLEVDLATLNEASMDEARHLTNT